MWNRKEDLSPKVVLLLNLTDAEAIKKRNRRIFNKSMALREQRGRMGTEGATASSFK